MKEHHLYWRRLSLLVGLFLRIGAVGFGGALGHIGLMEDIFVLRRQWLTEEAFREGVAISNVLPGATSMQLAVYIGYTSAGIAGGLLSGIAFILPAFLLMLVLSWAYMRYGTLPIVGAGFLAVSPVVIAIIGNTLFHMGKNTFKTLINWSIGFVACGLGLFPLLPTTINLPAIVLVAGLLGILLYGRSATKTEHPQQPVTVKNFLPLPLLSLFIRDELPALTISLFSLTAEFLKIGVLLFSCGFVIVPLLQQELVDGLHWLTMRQLLDGVALGQLTPGPFIIVATFVGYKLAGVSGATLATIAVFTPSFVLSFGLVPFFLRMRHSPKVHGFLKGVTPAVLGILTASTVILARSIFVNIWAICIAIISFFLLVRWKVNPIFLIGGAVLFGVVHFFL